MAEIINKEIEILSSGRFSLTIIREERGSKGIVRKYNNEEIVGTIERNHGAFQHSFFMRDGEEWLVSGKTCYTQTFLNMDTGEMIHFPDGDRNAGDAFCWARVYASFDAKTLAVDGCIWAGPYQIAFYDWSDIHKVPTLLEVKYLEENEEDFYMDPDFMVNIHWKGETDFEFDLAETQAYYNLTHNVTLVTEQFFCDVETDMKRFALLYNEAKRDKYQFKFGRKLLKETHHIFHRNGSTMQQIQ